MSVESESVFDALTSEDEADETDDDYDYDWDSDSSFENLDH